MASGALRAFSNMVIKYWDISIIGFNDRPNCEVTTPPLTSINVSKQGLAGESVDELMRMIQNPDKSTQEFRSRKIRIGTKLTVRESVSPPSKNV